MIFSILAEKVLMHRLTGLFAIGTETHTTTLSLLSLSLVLEVVVLDADVTCFITLRIKAATSGRVSKWRMQRGWRRERGREREREEKRREEEKKVWLLREGAPLLLFSLGLSFFSARGQKAFFPGAMSHLLPHFLRGGGLL